ncbi:DegT/DnrJ/EryC1/StrS family aminotransferase [Mesorhizobium sp. 1B3]|uniref:DegT/DnrJ/EryC1/StrS family aminotransferase n=1 Tax=Mesorhizobium sp. 1B3 TaxID=3243599 RepID=UPI003D956515
MSFKYPVYQPHFTGREREYVLDCLDSTWISSKGKYIGEFEGKFAKYLGADHALSVSNGTVALHLALAALGIGPGDEVLVPTLTYIASANAVTYTGANVVFVDSEPDHWQMDLADAERKITPKTRAIMPVHLYGHACDMEGIRHLAREYGLFVIEDCAEAIGTRFDGKLVGTLGDVGCFSFFGNKTVTTGEGGMLVTSDLSLADRISRLKGQGLARDREYWHDLVGFNYRMTNICAAIGSAQMEHIEQVVARKRQLANIYGQELAGLPVSVHGERAGTEHSYWMVTILTDAAEDRDPLRSHLRERGIETRPIFHPVHRMHMYLRPGQAFPVAEDLSRRGINLPSYPDLSDEDVGIICSEIRAHFNQVRG